MTRTPQILVEPTLLELLEDPVVRLVMASDGVKAADIRALAARVASRRHDGRAASRASSGDAKPAGVSLRAHPLPQAITRTLNLCGAC